MVHLIIMYLMDTHLLEAWQTAQHALQTPTPLLDQSPALRALWAQPAMLTVYACVALEAKNLLPMALPANPALQVSSTPPIPTLESLTTPCTPRASVCLLERGASSATIERSGSAIASVNNPSAGSSKEGKMGVVSSAVGAAKKDRSC